MTITVHLFTTDDIPLLADLKCGKINCEQHTLSETSHDRPGTTISKPPNPRDYRNCYFFLILFLSVYLCILILSEQKLDRYSIAEANPKLCIRLLSQEELMRLSVLSKYSYDVKIQF